MILFFLYFLKHLQFGMEDLKYLFLDFELAYHLFLIFQQNKLQELQVMQFELYML